MAAPGHDDDEDDLGEDRQDGADPGLRVGPDMEESRLMSHSAWTSIGRKITPPTRRHR